MHNSVYALHFVAHVAASDPKPRKGRRSHLISSLFNGYVQTSAFSPMITSNLVLSSALTLNIVTYSTGANSSFVGSRFVTMIHFKGIVC